MKPTADQIIKKYHKAYSIKSTWDTQYRDVFEYCMPARDGYDKALAGETIDKNYQDRRENLYSSVGEQSANEFVNTMQEVLAPPMSPWISLTAGFGVKEENKEEFNGELGKITEHANEYKNNSSFDMAFSEFCYDLFAGTACLLILPGRPRKPISFKAIPLREYSIEEGVNGEVRGVYRKYSMKAELIGAQWKELEGYTISGGDQDKEVSLIESTYFDYDLNVYHYQVIDDAEATVLVHREYKTNPYTVLRWNKLAGEPYGRGVGMTAINDIKTLNLIKYYSLRNFAFQVPILLAQEDDMLDVDSFDPTPLTLNVVPDTQNSIVPLNIAPKYDQESYKTEELTMDIKKNTYSSTLPPDVGANKTATEIRARLAELRKSLNSVGGRLVYEGIIPMVLRIIDVLGDTGVMGPEFYEKFNIDDVDGIKVKVNVITPIGKIIRYEEAQAMLAVSGTLLQFDPSGQVFSQYVKDTTMIPDYLELSGLPNKYINTTKEAEAIRQQQGQAQAQAQQAAVDSDVEASNQKEMGKAMANSAVENV